MFSDSSTLMIARERVLSCLNRRTDDHDLATSFLKCAKVSGPDYENCESHEMHKFHVSV